AFAHPAGEEGTLAHGMLYPVEDPLEPGAYYMIDGSHFHKNGSGRIFKMIAEPTARADQVQLFPVSSTDHQLWGRYRDPLPLSGGRMLAAHTPTTADTTDA